MAAGADRDPVGAAGGGEVAAVPTLAGDRVLDRDVDGADAVSAGARVGDGASDGARPAAAVVVAVRRQGRCRWSRGVVGEAASCSLHDALPVSGGVGCLDGDGVGVAVAEG